MDVSVIEIDEESLYLQDVIKLGDANKDTLGLLPRAAYTEAARHRNILVAHTPEGQCVGYLLYRIVKTKHRAAITHLCVDEHHRGNGLGRKLIEHLVKITKDLLGISLYCKRSYESNSFWPHIGFQYSWEKPGRGKERATLTHYWYDHNQPSLIKLADRAEIESKTVQAVIDANIFVYLYENSDHPLLADWLMEDLALCITPELYNEINRDDSGERRRAMLRYARTFPEVAADQTQVEKITELIRPHFPLQLDTRTRSDLKQLAYAIASEADFFVTNDRNLIDKLGEVIYDEYGLSIVADDDLIVYLDELMKEAAYQPRRLAGTPITIARVSIGQSDVLAEIFHRYSGEKKSRLRARLSDYLAYPRTHDTFVITAQDQGPLALVVLEYKDSRILEIPLMRVIGGSLSPALESRLLFWAVAQAVERNRDLTKVTDAYLSDGMLRALAENSFTEYSGTWMKFNLNGVHDTTTVAELLREYAITYAQESSLLEQVQTKFEEATAEQNLTKLIAIEKALWPLKLADANIPTYIVPIQPTWAMDLFDYELGRQTLFGSDPSLIFKMENVYYRSSRTKLPTSPSRVLWYVSQGSSGRYYDVMAVRACSYVEETVVGRPKELFQEFSTLGVYRWQNVVAAAEGDLNREILAFRFSRTELFKNPIYLDGLKQITGQRSAPFSPRAIDSDIFAEIYARGIAK